MNKREKAAFVRSLTTSVQKEILGKISKMPEEWNGFELRRYIADKFAAEAVTLDRRTAKAYRNEVYVRNL